MFIVILLLTFKSRLIVSNTHDVCIIHSVVLTLQDRWIGGYVNEGVRVRGFEALKQILSPHFILLEEEDMPFIIRETIRKHQWVVAHATVWMRKLD